MKTLLLVLAFPLMAHADDLLLDTLQGKAPVPEKAAPTGQKVPEAQAFHIQKITVDISQLTDPFQKHMYAQFEMADKVPYDVQYWANLVLSKKYAEASHLWSVVEPQIPDKLTEIANGAYLYSLWNLGLNQTFFNQWTKRLNNQKYIESTAEANLELTIAPQFDQWLLDNSIILTSQQQNIAQSLDAKSPMAKSFQAWAAVRKGELAEKTLDSISPQSPMVKYLAETAALAHARKGDLVGVARLLKKYIQPAIERTRDSKTLAQYYMTIGRLLYQAGNLPAAKEFYEKVPNSSPKFLEAREELAWVLLRQGNIPQLRGEMKTLSTPLFDDKFAPDIYVVRSISNLKMCFYDAVQKDFEKFNSINKVWAKKIDEAIASSVSPAPLEPDFFSTLAEKALNKLQAEQTRLDQLGKDSIGAALPAVGIQKHWREAQNDLQAVIEDAKKDRDQEYRRQWKNSKSILSEAIRKMRFVKVEFLTQVKQLADGQIDKTSLVATNGPVVPTSSLAKDSKDIIFPLDTEPWPDELFKLKSSAQGKCVRAEGKK